jgi:hypothetical protein
MTYLIEEYHILTLTLDRVKSDSNCSKSLLKTHQ